MKRSSARRARRWILQELTRWLDQRDDPLPGQIRFTDGKPVARDEVTQEA